MNTKQNTLKNILCSLIGIILIVMAQFGLVMLKQPNFKVMAENSTNNGSVPITITNPSFSSSTSKVTGFESFGYISNTDSNIVDLSKNDYPNAKRESADNYVLGISSKSYANYGYKNSSSNLIKLDPNSNYMITVDVYTNANSAIADLYLFNGEEVYGEISNINTNYSWLTHTFFVSTNELTKIDLALGMCLDGSGAVLFDNITINKLSEQVYLSNIATAKTKNQPHKIIENDSNLIARYKMSNGSFVKLTEDYDLNLTTNELSTINDSSTLTKYSSNLNSLNTSINFAEYDTDGSNNYALTINNEKESFVEFHTEDNFLTFKQNNIYKVSLNVKTENLSGNAHLQLVRTNAEENDANAKDSSILTISTANTGSNENVTNNYETYSFYVYSDPYKDTTYKLVFGLGDNEKPATGKLYVNTLTISKINYSTYKAASSSNQVDLVSYYSYSNTESNSLPMLNNGEFNAMEVTDVFSNKPAAATNWTVSTGKNKQYYGIVNASAESFKNLKSLNTFALNNPYGDAGNNNNILMMYNESEDTLSYTSSTRSLDANSYHKYTIDLNTQLVNNNDKVSVALVTTLNNKEVVLTSKDVIANNGFNSVDLFIHTANQKLNVALKITLSTSTYGYVYVDNAKFDYPIAPSKTQYDNTNEGLYVAKVDLENHNSNINYFTSNNNSVVTKVINLGNSSDLLSYTTDENKESFTSLGEIDAIAIRAHSDVNYTLTSNLGYDLTYSAATKNYYKITVYVYTQYIDSTNDEIEEKDLGAGIKIAGLNESFTKIQSNNVWTPYTFYINPTSSSTIYLEFSLGSEEHLTKGDVFFANITFEDVTSTLTEDEFNAIEENNTIKVIKNDTSDVEDDTTEDNTTENETEETKPELNTILSYAAGIITTLAILIAVIGIGLRKIKFKKPVKKSKTEYDRNKTVSKQLYMRKATTERENKLIELNKDLETLSAERVKFEEDYKKDLSKLRELKIKRASASEISKFEREMKKNQKASASLGVTLNKIQSEIEYVKTDAYLNSLMRKLARDTNSTTNKPEEE